MELYEVLKTRRSIRDYSKNRIDENVLNKVMEAARIAPSGSNRQPWKFIIIKDNALKEKLVPLCHNQAFIAQAPVVIVACSLKIQSNRGKYMGIFSVLLDVAIAVDHLTLAARNEGLGTCWIGAFENDAIKTLLGIPEENNIVALTPLGYPNDNKAFSEVSGRKNLLDIICYEKWS